MCIYTLQPCPLPDHDPIIALVFDPSKLSGWQICDRHQPWGRLSCGNLEVQHSIVPPHTVTSPSSDTTPSSEALYMLSKACTLGEECAVNSSGDEVSAPARSQPALVNEDKDALDVAKCHWCSVVLMRHAHKFKEVQAAAEQALNDMDIAFHKNHHLMRLHQNIRYKERELEALKHEAWVERTKTLEEARLVEKK